MARFFRIVAVVWLLGVSTAYAQFRKGEAGGSTAGKAEVSRWQIGIAVKAGGGPCRNGAGYMAVPREWPEQEVNVVKEDKSPEMQIRYTQSDNGVKVMNIKMGQLAAGHEARALVTFEIRRTEVVAPKDTSIYELPDVKKLPHDVRQYLTPSPKIESRDSRIRELAKSIPADKDKAWKKVEAIYDWVRGKVKYKPGKLKGALAALRDGTGDCEEIASLFIAICRAADIPARTVWVPGHCYSEFYLVDDKGEGHWFPCQSAGDRQFGCMNDLRPIWQKGDNIYSPIKKQRVRYMDLDITVGASVQPEVRGVRIPAPK